MITNTEENWPEERVINLLENRLLRERRKKSRIRFLFTLIISGIIVYVLFNLIIGIAIVQGNSMKPNLVEGNVALFYRISRNYDRNDLVIFPSSEDLLIKRVVAIAGDTVDIDDSTGTLLINGIAQNDEMIIGKTYSRKAGISYPVTVPVGSIFVLGDNRENALDSRDIGVIPTNKLIGKVVFVIKSEF